MQNVGKIRTPAAQEQQCYRSRVKWSVLKLQVQCDVTKWKSLYTECLVIYHWLSNAMSVCLCLKLALNVVAFIAFSQRYLLYTINCEDMKSSNISYAFPEDAKYTVAVMQGLQLNSRVSLFLSSRLWIGGCGISPMWSAVFWSLTNLQMRWNVAEGFILTFTQPTQSADKHWPLVIMAWWLFITRVYELLRHADLISRCL